VPRRGPVRPLPPRQARRLALRRPVHDGGPQIGVRGQGSGVRSQGSEIMVFSDSWPLTPDSWFRAVPSASLPVGALAKVVVEGKPVLLARLEDGTVAAASAVCPHRGEDLSGGRLYFGAIDCPLHH